MICTHTHFMFYAIQECLGLIENFINTTLLYKFKNSKCIHDRILTTQYKFIHFLNKR